jgi:hypothetical protein
MEKNAARCTVDCVFSHVARQLNTNRRRHSKG